MRILCNRTWATLLAGSLWAGTLVAATLVDIRWSPEGRFVHQAPIAAGQFVEVCGKLAAGDRVRWRFTASAPLDFNIHYHVGKDVVYPVKQLQVSSAQAELPVSAPQDYCWMWTNKGSAPATWSVELAR